MWRTPDGIRRLQDAEARLVCAAATTLYEQLKARGEPAQIGARSFDRLTTDQQMFAVLTVAQRLTDDLRPISLEAWSEAAVFAVFECVHAEVAFEIGLLEEPDAKPSFRWRRLVRDAWVEKWGDGPAVACMDVREWDFSIASLTKLILWDLDFLDEEHEISGCLSDYFTAQPPEWTPCKQRDLLSFYEQIVRDGARRAA